MRAHLRRIEAEWIMDQRDWKETKRREKAEKTQTLRERGNGSLSPQPTSSSGAHGQASAGDTEANGYRPEMDETRCFLWAHGGLHPYPFCPNSPVCLQILFHAGGYYFGSVNQERYGIFVVHLRAPHPDWNM